MEEEKEKGKFKLKLRWKDKLFLGVLIFLLFWMGYNEIIQRSHPSEPIQEKKEQGPVETLLQVGQRSLSVEVVTDPEAMVLGLGGRGQLAENQGMLFLHEKPAKYVYSMKGMNFGLDFVFINQGRIVELKENIPKDFSGEIFSEKDYDSVLEVPAGWAEKKGIKVGDEVSAQK